MRIVARQVGIDDDGPLTPLLEAIMLTLERLGTPTDRNAVISAEHAAALDIALSQAHRSTDAETERCQANHEDTGAKPTTKTPVPSYEPSGSQLGKSTRLDQVLCMLLEFRLVMSRKVIWVLSVKDMVVDPLLVVAPASAVVAAVVP